MLTALALLIAAPPAAAEPASPNIADARCVALFSYLVANQPAGAATARAGVLYFTGKLYGRNPHADLTALLRIAGKAIEANPTAELPRCRAEAAAAVHALAIAGRTIARGK